MARANPKTQPSKTIKRNGKSQRTAASGKARTGVSATRRTRPVRTSRANGIADLGATAQTLLSRSKTALGEAYHWAEDTGHDFPRTARKMGARGAQGARSLLEENPLVLAVIGLGLGVAASAVMPNLRIPDLSGNRQVSTAGGGGRTARKASRR
jgi:DNA-binding transcriptional regulator LsrR (DeoR family)